MDVGSFSGHSRKWCDLFVSKESDYKGYVNSLNSANKLVELYEVSTFSHFIKHRKPNKDTFGTLDFDLTSDVIRFKDAVESNMAHIKYDGVPFIIMGSQRLYCHQGRTRNTLTEIPLEEGKEKKRKPSKKQGCNASITIRHIVRFPSYEIVKDVKSLRAKSLSDLKLTFIDGNSINEEHRFVIELPSENMHKGHDVKEEIASRVQPVDKRISDFIHKCVEENNVSDTRQMMSYLEVFLKLELCPGAVPLQSNSRFWPSKSVIRNHMASSTLRKGTSSSDPQPDIYLEGEQIESSVATSSFPDNLRKTCLKHVTQTLKELYERTRILSNSNSLDVDSDPDNILILDLVSKVNELSKIIEKIEQSSSCLLESSIEIPITVSACGLQKKKGIKRKFQ